jgi:hypothetical protein
MAGNPGNQRRRIVAALGLFAVLALIVGLMTAPMASAGGGSATIAKKKFKCKKGFKKVTVKGKKKCKKKKPVVVVLPAPLVRGTITWNEATDVDLHAYDSSGNHSGWVGPPPGGIVQGIPNSTHSPDADGVYGKSESFTDNIFLKGATTNREFTFVGCFYGTATGTFTGVTAAGVVTNLPFSEGPNPSSIVYQVPGGPPQPVTSPC